MAEHNKDQTERRAAFAGIQNTVSGDARIVVQAGTVHAGVHVHYSDAPYHMEPFKSPSLSPPDHPAALLIAERRLVPFTGRHQELNRLSAWLNKPAGGSSAILIHGAGGQGKTRLALEFCTRAAGLGWNVVVARHNKEMAPATNASVAPQSDQLLVFVDDADQWPTNDLEWLFFELQQRASPRTRVMLTARDRDWWPPVRLGQSDVEFQEMPLEPLALTPAARREAFIAARAAFAGALDVTEPEQIPTPDLSQRVWDSALTIHQAALACVETEREGRQLPTEPLALSAYLLSITQESLQPAYANDRREKALIAAEGSVRDQRELAASEPDLHLPSLAVALHNFSVHLSAHGRRLEAAEAAAEAVGIYRDLAERDQESYGPGEAAALNNLGLMLAEVGAHYEALEATEDSVARYRGLTDIAPELYTPKLASVLHNRANRLAVLGRSDDALDSISEAVATLRLLTQGDPDTFRPGLAAALSNFSARLNDVGRQAEALRASSEAVVLARELAMTNPTAYEPTLASALNNLGVLLAAANRHDEALSAIREALELRRESATADLGRGSPDLAKSLNTLGSALGEVGRYEEALDAAGEAVELYRQLTAVNPAAWLPDLASSLLNSGTTLGEVGRHEEALNAVGEAVQLYQQLAESNPAAWLPDLARALRGSAGVLASNRSTAGDALIAAEESAKIYEELARRRPLAFQRELTDAREIITLISEME
jgi:tetratricopeptide (TPR) repeat protein